MHRLVSRLRASLLATLAPLRTMPTDARAAFLAQVGELNQRRVRLLLPGLALIHAVVASGLAVAPAPGASALEQLWLHDLLICHRVALPFAALTATFAWVLPLGDRRARWLGGATTAGYLAISLAITLDDQRLFPSNVGTLALCFLATAVLFRLGAVVAAAVYGLGFFAFVVGIGQMELPAAAVGSATATTVTAVLIGFLVSRSVYAAMARELTGRRTIEAQAAQLAQANAELAELSRAQAQLNDELERRVAAQVGEILGHSREVEGLNAQLKERVRERSRELSTALARLASERGDSKTLLPGTVLGDRVTVVRLLGRGGMGAVYLARDRVSGSDVAVKVVQASSSQELDGLHRFLREADLTASLSHPAIVRSLHVDVSDDGRLFQVLELVDGETLGAVLARLGPLPGTQVARLGAVIADGLAAAHAAGVVHRDVKPGNIMLTAAAPGVKLLDFGVARLAAPDAMASGSNPTTRFGFIVGTPEFMAPEQAVPAGHVDAAADVYSLGLVLFAAAAGRSPYDAASAPAFLHAHATATPLALTAVVPEAPAALAAWIGRCLAKTPGERPGAVELARALGELADHARVPPAAQLGLARSGHVGSELATSATVAVGAGVLTDDTVAPPKE